MLTAAALSVTVGVLIGIVLILGDKARQPSVASTAGLTAATSTAATGVTASPAGNSSAGAIDGGTGAQLSVLPVASSPIVTSPSPPAPVSTPSTTSTPRGHPAVPTSGPPPPPRARVTATRSPIVLTTITLTPPGAVPTKTATSAATPPTRTTRPIPQTSPPRTPATTAPPAGGPAPGRACPALGAKTTASGGFTVFCQRDFRNGSLAWRAVVDGGGCLSKKMTGIGTDGQRYRCRPDRTGLDHWHRA